MELHRLHLLFSHFFFSFQTKQSHYPRLEPNLFVFLNLCANSGRMFLQVNSALLSQVRNSACCICDSLSPCAHRQTVWMFTKSQVPKQMHYFFFSSRSEFLHLFIFTYPAHIHPKGLDTNSQMPNMLMLLWTQSLEYSMGKECLIYISIQDLLRICSIISSEIIKLVLLTGSI